MWFAFTKRFWEYRQEVKELVEGSVWSWMLFYLYVLLLVVLIDTIMMAYIAIVYIVIIFPLSFIFLKERKHFRQGVLDGFFGVYHEIFVSLEVGGNK